MLGARLKQLRKAQGLTQHQVAETLGVNRETYSHYETERRKLTPHTLTILAQLFDVSTDYMLGRTDKPHSTVLEFIKSHRATIEQLLVSISAGRLELDGRPLSAVEKECLEISLTIARELHPS